jgi:uncharacterized protein (DUF1697 family)
MQLYAAFLRAINVGGHVVRMDQLRSLFAEMGFGSVSTVVASGNVIFEASPRSERQLESLIARKLHDALGYEVGSFVRTAAAVAEVVAYEPFSRADLDTAGIALSVVFLESSPSSAAREKLLALRTSLDDFHVAEREAYWLCRTKMSESPVFKRGSLEKTLGVPGTARNITTVRKVSAALQTVGGRR